MGRDDAKGLPLGASEGKTKGMGTICAWPAVVGGRGARRDGGGLNNPDFVCEPSSSESFSKSSAGDSGPADDAWPVRVEVRVTGLEKDGEEL